MNALHLTLFVSLGLALLGVLFFLFGSAQKTSEHHDRLALLPLEDDDVTPSPTPATPSPLVAGDHPDDHDDEDHHAVSA